MTSRRRRGLHLALTERRGTGDGQFEQTRYFLFADNPGMLGEASRFALSTPKDELESGSSGNGTVIASYLEVDPCQRYDSEGQDGWRPI